MKWSIFDSDNLETLKDVQDKHGVSAERLTELQGALANTKRKLELANFAQAKGQAQQRYEAMYALKKAVQNAKFRTRRDVLNAFNQGTLKTKVKDLMQSGLNVAYVDAVSAKSGATKVYKFETDKSGRIKLFVSKPDNPREAVSSGLYTITTIESTRNKAFAKIVKARSHSPKVFADAGMRKPRKPRISFDAKIKA